MKPGRPKNEKGASRIPLGVRVLRLTKVRLMALSHQKGMSQGEVIDWLVREMKV